MSDECGCPFCAMGYPVSNGKGETVGYLDMEASPSGRLSGPKVVRLGTIGHIDSGKTTLTAAILKVLKDNPDAEVVTVDSPPLKPDEGLRRDLEKIEQELRITVDPAVDVRAAPLRMERTKDWEQRQYRRGKRSKRR